MIRRILIVVSLLLGKTAVQAQQHSLSIKDMLALIETGQPRLRAHKAHTAAAKDNIDLARNTLMPNLTAGYQAGYATDNNITGMSYPGLMMPISGPVAPHSSNSLIPGTALAAYLQWTPITFGQRAVAIEKAAAQYRLSASTYDNALFQQRYTGILTYIGIIYLKRLLNTQQANIDRTQAGLRQSLVLAKQGLRPGLDTVQFQSLLAQSTMELLNTQKLYTAQVLELIDLTGLPDRPGDLSFTDTTLALQIPSLPDTTGGDGYTQNPVYRYYQTQVALSAVSLKEAERGWRPRLDFWANAFSRGSGIDAAGVVNKSDGWQLSRTNLGAGLQLSLPILQFTTTNIRKRQYRNLLQADKDQLAQADLDLRRQTGIAASNYRQNLLIAQQAPIQSRAARLSYLGLELSYRSGLVDFTRLTQGQYALLNAEMTEADANLQVWRALLDIGVAKGDLNLFTGQLK